MKGTIRNDISVGMWVDIVLKKDQKSGVLTRGRVLRHLTSASVHTRGIKVKLMEQDSGGENFVGRVQHILSKEEIKEEMRKFYVKMMTRPLFILIDKLGNPFVFNHYNSVVDQEEKTVLLFEERVDFELFLLPTSFSQENYEIVELDKKAFHRLFEANIPDYFRINGERKLRGLDLFKIL